MALTLTSLADLAEPTRLGFDEVIDVRSPAEYAEDHIPGAANLPVLDDAERARVGTIYVRESRFLARRTGAALVARNAARHLEGYLADKGPAYRPLVYCWRGGQRSGSFATILSQVGWRVETVEGGYKSYRRLVQFALYKAPVPAPVVVLDGNTGSAKTELLDHLRSAGLQVVDLEGMANHRGSLFGARPGGQPSQKTFESRLGAAFAKLDPARPVVVEAESSKIGERSLPPMLWRAMSAAPRVEVVAPAEKRALYLARAYADLAADQAGFAEVLRQLRPYHSAERIEAWQRLLAEGAFPALALELIEAHYDPRYAKSRGRTAERVVASVEVAAFSAAGLAAAAEGIAAEVAKLAGRAA